MSSLTHAAWCSMLFHLFAAHTFWHHFNILLVNHYRKTLILPFCRYQVWECPFGWLFACNLIVSWCLMQSCSLFPLCSWTIMKSGRGNWWRWMSPFQINVSSLVMSLNRRVKRRLSKNSNRFQVYSCWAYAWHFSKTCIRISLSLFASYMLYLVEIWFYFI